MKRILYPICILMMILICVMSMMTVSFSWFAPNFAEGSGLSFVEITSVRSQDCTLVTYSGTKADDGIINYYSTVTGSNTVNVGTGENVTPKVLYYKTVITNNNKNYDTNISLYLPSFSVGDGSVASIGVATPTNTYRTFNSTKSDIHIVRNAFVSANNTSKANSGSITVEWFVKCDRGSVTFDPSSVYLMYN